MNRNKSMRVAAALSVFACIASAPVAASGWEVWAEKTSADRMTIVASFAGDGVVDEAQVDLNISGGFELLDAKALVEGSVCVGSSEKNILRVVPPSGAGKALKKVASDTCIFTVRVTSKKGWSPTQIVGVTQTVCGSSASGEVACEATVKSLK